MGILIGQLQSQIGQNYHLFNVLIVYLKQLLSCLGRTLILCLECSIGLHIGGFVGWITGWCVALICKTYCEPIRFISFDVTRKWYYLPYEYGRYGMIAWAALGVLVIMLITLQNSLKKRELETNQSAGNLKIYRREI